MIQVKWNSLQDRSRKTLISRQDLSQMVSYATCYNVHKVFLVYPRQAQAGLSSTVVKINGADLEVVVVYVNVNETTGIDFESFIGLG